MSYLSMRWYDTADMESSCNLLEFIVDPCKPFLFHDYVPDEILMLIFEHLDLHHLKLMRCVNKRWYRVATALLEKHSLLPPLQPNYNFFEKVVHMFFASCIPTTFYVKTEKFEDRFVFWHIFLFFKSRLDRFQQHKMKINNMCMIWHNPDGWPKENLIRWNEWMH